MACYIEQIHKENKLVLLDIKINLDPDTSRIATPHVPNINKFTIWSMKKTLIYYISEKPAAFIIGFTLILIYSVLFPFISSDLWVGVNDEIEGLMFNNVVVSTYFSRFLDNKLLANGVSHTYLTLTENPSDSMIINFHISGETWVRWIDWDAVIEYWPTDDKHSKIVVNAANVYFNAPEKKAERLIFANKISGLSPDTLYTFKILYTDYSTGLRQESPEKLLRTFPNDPTLCNSLTVVFGGNRRRSGLWQWIYTMILIMGQVFK